jgi:hypothetical protein
MSVERLADALIACRCGTHSLGLVYEFLLKTYGDPKRARTDFLRFLSGELPPRLLKEAQLWVAEDQGALPSMDQDDGTATECAGDPALIPEGQSNTEYEAIQASW